ncbi:hypothetical protein BK004_03305 [bacterium CG10_46_32]|nr:MAG: hypothetical protein BK004_03305 [bacterium CG10_46_32]PIR55953.1 MAG: hypothetical protein COU73_03335 [Parcubacteria group bacterium CG10_big_fil_rev_8_21_14_0_10_46_32]
MAATIAVEQETETAYKQRLLGIGLQLLGKRMCWSGRNENGLGLQRDWEGTFERLDLLSGIGCRWVVRDVTEYRGTTPVATHSEYTRMCLARIDLPLHLDAIHLLLIPEINAKIILQEAEAA